MRVIRPASDDRARAPRPADRRAVHVSSGVRPMFAPIRPARWVAALTLVVVASTTLRAEDVYVENGVYVKQLPPWRQRMIQKKMLRRSGEVIVEAPPAVV